jgi:hypothetical protein
MPTPNKPVSVLKAEKRSHRTQAEISGREKAEAAVLTGKPMRERPEVKNNKIAHALWLEIEENFTKIGKNDAIYEAVLNRYCQIQAEIVDFEKQKQTIWRMVEKFRAQFAKTVEAGNFEPGEKIRLMLEFEKEIPKLTSALNGIDTTVQSKRRMLLDIEDRNVMTVAGALRTVSKQPKEEKQSDALQNVIGFHK